MKKLIVFIILIFIIIGISFFYFIKKDKKETFPSDFSWKAKYIWLDNNEEKNQWVCFRKNFNIENKDQIADAICKIAVDSKYWLYINDTLVVKDGQLKRGEKADSIYYDEINIKDYLNIGENNISILVWYFGKYGFSHVDSGQGALLFQAQIGEKNIISDETWKVSENLAYLDDEEKNNSRLSESNIFYNSNLEIEGWYLKNYDDSEWENATVCGNYDDEKWGELIKRDIPFFIFSEINEYENQEKNNNIIEAKLPYNMQVVPYIKVKSEKNQKIIISNKENFDNQEFYGKITYITKKGIQEFESPSWINGEKIYYYIPEDVEIISLGYRQTGYASQISGKFECNDDFLNSLWKMSTRTLYVNMRDTFMDCPDRERAMWIGDTSIEMEEAMYALDISSHALYEKCIKHFIGWQNNGVFYTVSPSISARIQIPVQNLLAICSMNDYYKYTGNKNFINYVYKNINEYMNLWNIGEDGIVSGNGYYFQDILSWHDSQGSTDNGLSENIWYYYALENLCKMSEELEYNEDTEMLKNKLDKMKKGINEKFWDGTGYKSENFEGYDVRVNSIAVLSGIAEPSKYDTILEIIKNNYDNSVFMEKYVLQALCEMEQIEIVQERIKTRYNEMVEAQEISTTLWEYWNEEYGSKNHAWAGGPLIIMSKYFAGISPLKPGYSEIQIKPNFGNLNKINTSVSTVKGQIDLEARKENDKLELQIQIPTKALVSIEKINNNEIKINNITIYEKGKFIENNISEYQKQDDKYLYVYIEKGKYNITSI